MNRNILNRNVLFFTVIGLFCAIGGFLLLKNLTMAEKDTKSFIVGTVAGYAPFVSIDTHGEYVGFDIDIANAVAQQMGKKLILKDLGSMASLFMALEQGSIDAIIWGLSITQDRLKKVTMIQYTGETTTAYKLIFWKTIPENIHTIEDMNGTTVCVEPASSQDVVISNYGFINKIPTEKVDDALLHIQYGKADAAFVEPAIAKKFKHKYPEIQILDVPLAPEDYVMGIGITLKKENVELAHDVRQAVEHLKSQGIISKLETQWDIS